jgi:hypothetical protein
VDFFKKLFIGSFVLLFSAAIFYLLMNDKTTKDDILRTTLETLGSEVLAMMPDGESKSKLDQKFQEFMTKVGNNELSKAQIQTTTASILNLKMDANLATPEVIEAVLEVRIDTIQTTSPHDDFKIADKELSLNKRELAGQIKRMMSLQEEIERISDEDTLSKSDIKEKIVFSADSGLQVWISPEIMEQHVFIHNPEFLQKIKALQEQDIVQYYNFKPLNDLGLAGLKFAAPFLSQKDKEKIKIYLKQNPPSQDSLNFERFIPHPDSLKKVIEIILTAEKQIKEMEEWQSVED